MSKKCNCYILCIDIFEFGYFLPLLMMMSYNHPIYQKLIKKALKTGIPITTDDIDREVKKRNIKYDCVN